MCYYTGQEMSGQPIDIKSRVARNIRRAMAEGDLTSAELARRMDDHERQIRRWRNGEVMPRSESLALLALELGHDPAWFYMDHSEGVAA